MTVWEMLVVLVKLVLALQAPFLVGGLIFLCFLFIHKVNDRFLSPWWHKRRLQPIIGQQYELRILVRESYCHLPDSDLSRSRHSVFCDGPVLVALRNRRGRLIATCGFSCGFRTLKVVQMQGIKGAGIPSEEGVAGLVLPVIEEIAYKLNINKIQVLPAERNTNWEKDHMTLPEKIRHRKALMKIYNIVPAKKGYCVGVRWHTKSLC